MEHIVKIRILKQNNRFAFHQNHVNIAQLITSHASSECTVSAAVQPGCGVTIADPVSNSKGRKTERKKEGKESIKRNRESKERKRDRKKNKEKKGHFE
jgi:hypothetical protein